MAYIESLSEEDIELLKQRLYEAAAEGRVDDVSQLSTHFTGDVDTSLGAALYKACVRGQLNVVAWLVEQTVVRDDGEQLGEALMEACRYGQWNIVKWLVNNTQVDVNYADGSNNILHRVISFNPTDPLSYFISVLDMTELCRLMYVCGEDVKVLGNYDGYTPLHWACFYDNSDSVGALLLAGADETITNDRGQTPVQYAVKEGNVEVLSLLDVSSKWKLLVRSHRLRRRTAVRVMMTLVKWKVQQTRSMWTRAIMHCPKLKQMMKIAVVVGRAFVNVCFLSPAVSTHAAIQGSAAT
jgi:hypothetical protein